MKLISSKTRIISGILTSAGVALLIGTCLPASAQAPPEGGGKTGDSGSTTKEQTDDKMVSLDAENLRLVDVIPDLMKSANAEFVIDREVKQVRLTIHISKAKLKVTLDSMMKVCNGPVHYKVEDGIYHFIPGAELEKAPSTADLGAPLVPRVRGPKYNGGDPIEVATSELFQFLTGSEPALSGKSPFPDGRGIKAGLGNLSGSRSFSEYGFLNGKISHSGYETPDMASPDSSSTTFGYGYFPPIGNGRGRRQ